MQPRHQHGHDHVQHRRASGTHIPPSAPMSGAKLLNSLYKSRFACSLALEPTIFDSDTLRHRLLQVERAATASNAPSPCAVVLVSSGERAKKLNILRVFSEDPLRYSGGEVRMSNQYIQTDEYAREGIASMRGIIGTPNRVHDAYFTHNVITFERTQILVVDNDILENKPEQRMPCLSVIRELLRCNSGNNGNGNGNRRKKNVVLFVNPTIPIPNTPFYIDANSNAVTGIKQGASPFAAPGGKVGTRNIETNLASPSNRVLTHQNNTISNHYNSNNTNNASNHYNHHHLRQNNNILMRPPHIPSPPTSGGLWAQYRAWALREGYSPSEIPSSPPIAVVKYTRDDDWKLRAYIAKAVSYIKIPHSSDGGEVATTACIVVAASGDRAKRLAALDWPDHEVYRLFGGAGSLDFQRTKLSETDTVANARKYTFGTPQRIRHFCNVGSLSLQHTHHVVVDAAIVDAPPRTKNQCTELFYLFAQHLQPALAKITVYKQLNTPPDAANATTHTNAGYQKQNNAPNTTVPYNNNVRTVPVVSSRLALEPKKKDNIINNNGLKPLRDEAEDRLRGMYCMWTGGTHLPPNLKVGIATNSASLRRVAFTDFSTNSNSNPNNTAHGGKYDPTTVSTLVFAPSGVRCDRLSRSLLPSPNNTDNADGNRAEPLRLFGGPENMGKQRDFLERTRVNTIKVAVALPDRVKCVVKENILTLNGTACIVIDNHLLENLDNVQQRNDLFHIISNLANVQEVFFLIYFPPPPSANHNNNHSAGNNGNIDNRGKPFAQNGNPSSRSTDSTSGGTSEYAEAHVGSSHGGARHEPEENAMDRLLESPGESESDDSDSELETANNTNNNNNGRNVFNHTLAFKPNSNQVQKQDFQHGGADLFVKKLHDGSYQVNVSKIKPGVSVEVKFNADGAQSVAVREE